MGITTPLAFVIGFMIGIIVGMAGLAYSPIRRCYAYFSVDIKYKNKILNIFGRHTGFSMDLEPDVDKVYVRFHLVRWFDFENRSAQLFLDGILKTLHKYDLKEINSGVH